jgi:hypothetical protein
MKSKRTKGKESEKKAAKKVGGSLIRSSGTLWYNKGDYETKKIVFQNKYSGTGFYQLKISDLIKAEKDSLTKNKDFVFSMEINGEFIYCFPRVLISEYEESLLMLTEVLVSKSINIDERANYLVNDKYIIIHDHYFNKLKLGD